MDTRRVVNTELQLLRRIGTGSGSAEEAVEKIKRRRVGSGLCYLVQMPTSTATFKSISGESTWGRLFYQIAACLGDVRRKKKKKKHFLQSGAGKAKWKCNFTRLSFWAYASLFAAVTQRKARLSPYILMCFGDDTWIE